MSLLNKQAKKKTKKKTLFPKTEFTETIKTDRRWFGVYAGTVDSVEESRAGQ